LDFLRLSLLSREVLQIWRTWNGPARQNKPPLDGSAGAFAGISNRFGRKFSVSFFDLRQYARRRYTTVALSVRASAFSVLCGGRVTPLQIFIDHQCSAERRGSEHDIFVSPDFGPRNPRKKLWAGATDKLRYSALSTQCGSSN
jgi:hypothetical protein